VLEVFSTASSSSSSFSSSSEVVCDAFVSTSESVGEKFGSSSSSFSLGSSFFLAFLRVVTDTEKTKYKNRFSI
jgi:hypothetical protein